MTTTPTPEDGSGLVHQPTIPTMELPEYHGRKPVKMKTAIAGAGSRISRPHSIGDRIVLVVEVRVKSAGHEDTDDGLEYVEKYKVLDLFELDSEQGSRLISTVRSLYRTGEDAAKGRRPVPGLGEVGYTDASGIALLPEEVAELRGDPLRVMLAPELTPAVIVYDDGARDLWPDDYPKDAPRPKVGESYLTDAGDAVVTQLLHHETGETLAELDPNTDEAFAQRLEEATASAPSSGGTSSAEVTVTTSPATEPDSWEKSVTRTLDGEKPRLQAVPDLPGEGPGPFDGDLGDDVPGWEDEVPPRPLTAEEEETARLEALLPTSADFGFVDCQIPELVKKLEGVTDLAHARRLVLAERQGRGRGLKARAGAMKWLDARVAVIEEAGNAST